LGSDRLARRLGPFDATMLVMGGIVGSGIFMNPYVVARVVHTPVLILGAWIFGGVVALVGAFIYGELAARRPQVGGQYAYIREAFNPVVAFIYGWGLLLVTQTGGMAAVAVTFARYFIELTGSRLPDALIAALALGLLTIVNCQGVRAGSGLQSALMLTKVLAILGLIVCGFVWAGAAAEGNTGAFVDRPISLDLVQAFGAALIPVLFAYGGWQTASFVAGEMRDPRKDLPRGLLIGVTGVIILYLAVNIVCLRVLGPAGLAATTTPASDVMRAALGDAGGRLIAAGIAISTLGFLSQGMLTAPRVYFAMAEDGLFFRTVGRIDPRTQVPIVAIILQGVFAVLIALSGRYEQILNYVVSVDFMFFGIAAVSLFILRKRDALSGVPLTALYRAPGHPWTTGFFIAVCAVVVVNTIIRYPGNTIIGVVILLAGIPVYFFWRNRSER
jgi:basic amino acid/polyamine antiporter, APA family